ncbi:uncharacterized protein LOC105665242 [Ceratitis capitata]|uniref:DUF7775 domain-containing protein n=1 Tax=Ceratitis capitata TaxID=7213 RepID=W8AVQ8_CERCA|nr:uncharacterized protein LOC105665242 [Ceratitis capitata]
MQEVWTFFKLLEMLLGIVCLTFHVVGFSQTEPLPHNLFYCGTFASFTFFSFLGILNVYFGRGRTAIMEAIPTTLGAVMHFAASILSMYHAENDFHLMFLTDFEEPQHSYFFYCKAQSIAALTTGALYMLHATYAYDAVFIRTRRRLHVGVTEDAETEDETESAPRHQIHIEMFVLGKWCHSKLLRYKWFQKLAAKP